MLRINSKLMITKSNEVSGVLPVSFEHIQRMQRFLILALNFSLLIVV